MSSFGVVLMSCKVNFHVVQSALQYSASRIKNKIYLYLKKKIVFLDKMQAWCHIIVIVVPQGATQIVNIEKGKVGKMRGLKKENCSAEELM